MSLLSGRGLLGKAKILSMLLHHDLPSLFLNTVLSRVREFEGNRHLAEGKLSRSSTLPKCPDLISLDNFPVSLTFLSLTASLVNVALVNFQ